VVEEPFACHPSFAQGYYDRDNRFYLEWDAIAKDQASLDAWLDEWVLRPANHAEYVEKCGDAQWDSLRPAGAVRRGRLRAVRVSAGTRADRYSKIEIMIAASARRLGGVRELLRRRRAAEHRVQPRAADGLAGPAARVRVGRVRRAARAAAAVDRRPDARDRCDRRHVDVRAVRVLPAGGLIDVAFLGGAQIDRFGNLNTTVIGDYAHPKVRLPGSGGACEIAIHAGRSS
jgi:hypothetical protein